MDVSVRRIEADRVSELMKILDGYRDRHGQPSWASIARSIGVVPQTLDTWRHRGMKTYPRNLEPFRNLADLVGLDYKVIIDAIAFDVGLADQRPEYRWPEAREVKGA